MEYLMRPGLTQTLPPEAPGQFEFETPVLRSQSEWAAQSFSANVRGSDRINIMFCKGNNQLDFLNMINPALIVVGSKESL